MTKHILNDVYIQFESKIDSNSAVVDLAIALIGNNPYEISTDSFKQQINPEKAQNLIHNWIHNNRKTFNSDNERAEIMNLNIQNLETYGSNLSIKPRYIHVHLLWVSDKTNEDPNEELKREVIKLKDLIESNIIKLNSNFSYRTLSENSNANDINFIDLNGNIVENGEVLPKITVK